MSESKTQKELLVDYLIENYRPGEPRWKEIGEMFGFESEQARKIWLNYRQKTGIASVPTAPPTEEGKSIVVEQQEDFKTGRGVLTIQNTEKINIQDAEKLFDTEKWQIAKYQENYVAGKYQLKVWLEPVKVKESDIIENLIDNYQSAWNRIPDADKIVNHVWTDPTMLVINLNDLHFDKRDIENSTIDMNIQRYFKVLEYLVMKAYHSNSIEKIVFVVGNDMFNTDNVHDQTTNGTPQRCNTTWHDAYEKVFDTMIQSIAFLSKYAKDGVHVVLVQGNHDRSKSYYMAHALQQYFKNDPSVTFDRSANINKRYVYGNTFLGFNHGNNLNDKLPLAFAQEFYEDWGKARYHDIIISDKHHNNEKLFKVQTQNDGFQGVKLRILPSLSKPDTWHDDNLFRSRQSGIALVYDKERGKAGEWEYQL
jgi:hypothetical protein